MSAIDRAFIKAYSDEVNETAEHPSAPDKTVAADTATVSSVKTLPAATAQSPRRTASRTKRTAAAAAIRATEPAQAAATHENAQAEPVIASPPATPTAPGGGSRVKMVVGRQALKQLAETASVPPPHAAFSQKRPVAAAQVESQQLRVDPPRSAVADQSLAALEVDRLAWPPTCEALFDRAAADFETITAKLSEPSPDCGAAIAVLSIDEGHGGTTVAMCLARVLASGGSRVCLVDGDCRQPGLAESLGLDAPRGLETVFSGEATLGEVLIESLEDQLTMLPLSRPLAADALERSKLRQTAAFGELRDRFDIVLVDAGCVGAAVTLRSTAIKAGLIDAVILVGRETADITAWQRAREALAECNVPCLGAIANRCAA